MDKIQINLSKNLHLFKIGPLYNEIEQLIKK